MMYIFNYELVILIALDELDSIVLGCVYEGELIRARARHYGSHCFIFGVVTCQHGVAQSQMVEESLNLLVLGIDLEFDCFVQVLVNHVEICDFLLSCVIAVSLIFAVGYASDAHLAKDHVVLRECPCFVGEHIRHLAKFFG